jgi:integrase/recombinase XerD
MDLINNENNGLVLKKKNRKKRSQLDESIFSIYKSEKTIKDYMFYLKDFLTFVYESADLGNQQHLIQMMIEIDKNDIEDYLSHLLQERKLKKTSINKILFSLRSLYNELEKRGLENPFKFFPTLKVNKYNYDNVLKLSFEELNSILKNMEINSDKDYRNYLILIILFYTGMRSGELLNFKYNDIIKRNNEYVVKMEKTKSGKEQYKALHSHCFEKIDEFKNYIKNLYNLNDEEIYNSYIISSNYKSNSKMSYNTLYDIIKKLGLSIDKDISPHNIRHTVATELSLQGADILEIRDFLGHSDSKVTEIYINARNILEKKALNRLPKLED